MPSPIEMQKSLLNVYLERMSRGDVSCVEKLCTRLADRLVHVPVTNEERKGKGTKVSIVRLREDGRSVIPMFTSQKAFNEWCAENHPSRESISLLGADFCRALDHDVWLLIDPESETPVEFPPALVGKIWEEGYRETEDELPVAAPKTSRAPESPPVIQLATPMTAEEETGILIDHAGERLEAVATPNPDPDQVEAVAPVFEPPRRGRLITPRTPHQALEPPPEPSSEPPIVAVEQPSAEAAPAHLGTHEPASWRNQVQSPPVEQTPLAVPVFADAQPTPSPERAIEPERLAEPELEPEREQKEASSSPIELGSEMTPEIPERFDLPVDPPLASKPNPIQRQKRGTYHSLKEVVHLEALRKEINEATVTPVVPGAPRVRQPTETRLRAWDEPPSEAIDEAATPEEAWEISRKRNPTLGGNLDLTKMRQNSENREDGSLLGAFRKSDNPEPTTGAKRRGLFSFLKGDREEE